MSLSSRALNAHHRPGDGGLPPGDRLTLSGAQSMVRKQLKDMGLPEARGLYRRDRDVDRPAVTHDGDEAGHGYANGATPDAEEDGEDAYLYSCAVMIDATPVYFDYDPVTASLDISALIYHFRHQPRQATIHRVRDSARVSPWLPQLSEARGDMLISYEADNRGIYGIRRLYERIPRSAVRRDIDALLKIRHSLRSDEEVFAVTPPPPGEEAEAMHRLRANVPSETFSLLAQDPAGAAAAAAHEPATAIGVQAHPAAMTAPTPAPTPHKLRGLRALFRRRSSGSNASGEAPATEAEAREEHHETAPGTVLTPVSRMFSEAHGIAPVSTPPSNPGSPSSTTVTSELSSMRISDDDAISPAASGGLTASSASIASQSEPTTLFHPRPTRVSGHHSLFHHHLGHHEGNGLASGAHVGFGELESADSVPLGHQPGTPGTQTPEYHPVREKTPSSAPRHNAEGKPSIFEHIKKILGVPTSEQDDLATAKRNRHGAPKLQLNLDDPRPTGVPLKLYSSDTLARLGDRGKSI